MNRFVITIVVLSPFIALSLANAQMMGRFSNSAVDWNEVAEHTAREEQAGRELWDTLQAKEITCESLDDEQFGVLGEYFMGQMAGESHAAMNAMMIQMHGEDGEEQIHIVMGKRLSGCDASVSFPAMSGGWMPMMSMMWGGWSSPLRNNPTNNMMNFGFGPVGGFGWIFMVLWWVLVIAGMAALIKWLAWESRSSHQHGRSAVDVLKERYARGEIDKKEFQEKKRDLS